MTVTEKSSRKLISGSGWTNPLTHDFELENATHLKVYADDVELTLGVDYSITGVGVDSGYSVTISVPGSWAPDVWVLSVEPPISQADDVSLGGIFGARFEESLDALTRRVQRNRDGVLRAWKTPLTEAGEAPTMDVLAEDHFWIADADGNMIDGGAAGDIAAAQGYAVAAAASTLAAQDAEDGAEAAYAATLTLVPNFFPTTRTALKAANTVAVTSAYLKETGREGQFVWLAGNYSTQIAADTAEGVYIKADAIAATAGAWVRVVPGTINPMWFGPAGDGATNDYAALFCANAIAVIMGRRILFDRGTFRVNTNLTFAASTAFTGGILKPASGISVTLTGSFDALAVQMFDLSLGGTLLGSGAILSRVVYTEWWGANPANAGLDTQPFSQAAVNFLKQRSVSGGAATGGTVQYLQGFYYHASTTLIDSPGITLQGLGRGRSIIYRTSLTANIFKFQGAAGSGAACLGGRVFDLDFRCSAGANQPTSGAYVWMEECSEFMIERNSFQDPYIGVYLHGCLGSHVKLIANNTFTSSGAATVQAGSACIRLDGHAAPIAGITGLNERVYINNNTGTCTDLDYGILITGGDCIQMSGNHMAGMKSGCLVCDPDATGRTTNIYNIHGNGNVWEGLVSYSDYAVKIANNSSSATTIIANFSFKDEIINGVVAGAYVGGSRMVSEVEFTGCINIQAIGDSYFLENGKALSIKGGSIIDGDRNTLGGKSYVKIGSASYAPEQVSVDGVLMSQRYITPAPVLAYGVQIASGSKIRVENNDIKGAFGTAAIAATGGGANNYDIKNNNTDNNNTITSSPTASFPHGNDSFIVQAGGGAIDYINGASIGKGRILLLRFANAVTINHNTGANGFLLAGAANWTTTANSTLTIRWSNTASRWIEVSRTQI